MALRRAPGLEDLNDDHPAAAARAGVPFGVFVTIFAAVALAARLQALAAPNTLVIGEATRRQIGGLFDLEDLGPQ